jgi:hypothetical protein
VPVPSVAVVSVTSTSHARITRYGRSNLASNARPGREAESSARTARCGPHGVCYAHGAKDIAVRRAITAHPQLRLLLTRLLSDALSAEKIDALLRKWLRRLPHPYSPADRKAGFLRARRTPPSWNFSRRASGRCIGIIIKGRDAAPGRRSAGYEFRWSVRTRQSPRFRQRKSLT